MMGIYTGGADEQLERALARVEDLEEEKDFWVREAAKFRDEADYMATEWGKLHSEAADLEARVEQLIKALARTLPHADFSTGPAEYVVTYKVPEAARIREQFTHHMDQMREIHGTQPHRLAAECWCKPEREDYR